VIEVFGAGAGWFAYCTPYFAETKGIFKAFAVLIADDDKPRFKELLELLELLELVEVGAVKVKTDFPVKRFLDGEAASLCC